MTFYDNGEDEVRAKQIIPAKYQGYPGIVHGGVQAAILDEIVGRVSLIEDFHRFMMSVSNCWPQGAPTRQMGKGVRENLSTRRPHRHGSRYDIGGPAGGCAHARRR